MKIQNHNGSTKKKVLIVVVCIAAVLTAGYFVLRMVLKSVVSSSVTDTMMSTVLEKTGLVTSDEAQEIVDSIPAEDKETVTNIIMDHADADTIAKATSYLQNNDMSGLKEYALNELSAEEVEQLKQVLVDSASSSDLGSVSKEELAQSILDKLNSSN